MRKPFDIASLKALYAGPRWAVSRPDVLRREALLFNTLVILGAVAVAYPVAIFMLTTGAVMPIAAVTTALGLGTLALVFHIRRAYEAELACQVSLIGLIGGLLTLADNAIIDFGLALALMATLKALLVSQSRRRHLAWGFPAAALVASVLAHHGAVPNPFAPAGPDGTFMAIVSYICAVLIVAVTANRLNTTASATARSQMKTFSMLVESVKDAVIRFGSDGETLFISKSATKLFGCPRYELDNAGLFDRIHIMDRPAYLAALSAASRKGLHQTLDIRMRRNPEGAGATASYIWIELALSPVVDVPGEQGRWEVVGVLRDISARKDAESATNKARVDAEQASEAKSRFLATIGHELRTPLNAIVGFSDMMKAGIGGTPSAQHMEYAGLISQSGHHLLDVVNMLLDMSKIEAGKFEVQAELFDPAGLVEPCVQIVEKSARDRGIEIRTAIPAKLPQLLADERACRQMLINLLSNAVKFSHDGGTVRCEMKRQGRMLLMSVSDTGIGMGTDTINRVGEPFLQGQDGLSRRYEGTGLGLSIVKGLVGLHDGKMHIVSEQGEGTTVSILLPLDGPERLSRPSAKIARLHPSTTGNDQEKWLEDEKRSAAL